jgi:DNA (cytosine-5)-methyltransferase 1
VNTAIDLFAGPGGWDVAARDLGIDTVGIEFDAAACATRYAAGLKTIKGDVRNYGPGIFETEGLIASPPCQTFSMAGNGSGRRALDDVLIGVKELQERQPLTVVHDDERTGLVLEPLRWAIEAIDAGRPYRWIALEQVPTVLPVWDAVDAALETEGYSVLTGYIHSEAYGVPQTRKRAVMIAHLDRPVRWPQPTHSRYHNRSPERLDDGVLPWVSMAEALGVHDATGGDPAKRGERSAEQPTLAFGNDAASHLFMPLGTSLSDMVAAKLGKQWTFERPATTVQGDPRIGRPGHKHRGPDCCAANAEAGVGESMFASGSVRVTIEEAAVLQTFPADYPWQGTQGKKFQQIGNAVPPLMARAILSDLIR